MSPSNLFFSHVDNQFFCSRFCYWNKTFPDKPPSHYSCRLPPKKRPFLFLPPSQIPTSLILQSYGHKERRFSCWLSVKLLSFYFGYRFNRKQTTQFTLWPHSDWHCCEGSGRNRASLGNPDSTFGSSSQLHHLWENTNPDSRLFSNTCCSTKLLCQPHVSITSDRSCLSSFLKSTLVSVLQSTCCSGAHCDTNLACTTWQPSIFSTLTWPI